MSCGAGDNIDIFHFQVIVDFRGTAEDQAKGKKCRVIPSSFYTAITRVHCGEDLFLRSFEKRFISNNEEAEREITRMRKTRQFSKTKVYLDENIFKGEKTRPFSKTRVYLDENIFKGETAELKVGYLNINGLLTGLHGDYLNADKNLLHLDLLCLAETHLLESTTGGNLSSVLSNWEILQRFDSDDKRQHLGLLLLRSKASKVTLHIIQCSKLTLKRKGENQCQV